MLLPVIEEPQCNHFQGWSSWLHRQGVVLFCIRSCRRHTESICSPRDKIHLHGNFFYSMTLVNTDSLGMVKSLQHSRYRDVAMRVMASYTQWPYTIQIFFRYNGIRFSSHAWDCALQAIETRFVMWPGALSSCVSFRTDEYSPRNFSWARVCRFIFRS